MSKLLRNKRIVAFLGLALSVLLVVALIPQINIAHGSKDDVLVTEETSMAVTGDITEDGEELDNLDGTDESGDPEGTDPDGTDPAPDGEETQTSDQDYLSAAMALKDEVPNAELYNEEPKEQPDEDIALGESGELKTINNPKLTIAAKKSNKNAPVTLTYNEPGTYKLEVNGTLYADIVIDNSDQITTENQQLGNKQIEVNKQKRTVRLERVYGSNNGTINVTITGSGKIVGSGNQSVIQVIGKGSKLIFNGPTVTNAKVGTANTPKGSTAGDNANSSDELDEGYDNVGGGILVRRSNKEGRVAGDTTSKDKNTAYQNDNGAVVSAALHFMSGTVTGNTANAGGGIFIDRGCGFTMDGGTVSHNTATKWEAGGIYIAGNYDADGNQDAKVNKGFINNNVTLTRFSWGGGGIFVENKSKTYVGKTIITNNKAHGLGGGVSGCPHAIIGIGKINETVAVFCNEALKENDHQPHNRWLHNLGTGTNPTSGDLYAYGDTTQYSWLRTQDQYGIEGKPYSGSYTVGNKEYSSSAFTAAKAMDFYCTKASYVYGNLIIKDATNQLPAFTGYWANASGGDNLTVGNGTMLEKTGCSVGLTHYLTPTMEKDYTPPTVYVEGYSNPAVKDSANYTMKDYDVYVVDNESYTHGGGVGCNGELLFGKFNNSKDYEPFSFSFNKEILLGDSTENVELGGETFKFKLAGNGKEYNATSNADGLVTFRIDNLNLESSQTVNFTLNEELTEAQVEAGYRALSGIPVSVAVNVTSKTEKRPLSATNCTIYTPTVTAVSINNSSAGVVQNRIYPTTQVSLPVTKTISGFGLDDDDTFTFVLNKVDTTVTPEGTKPQDLVTSSTELQGLTLEAGQFTNNSAQANFDALAYDHTQTGTYWYTISENPGFKPDVSYDESVYLAKVEVTLSTDKKRMENKVTYWKADSQDGTFEAISDEAASAWFENVAMQYAPFPLEFTKQVLNTLETNVGLNGETYNFNLTYGGEWTKQASNDENGEVTFTVDDTSLVKGVYEGGEPTLVFTLSEEDPDNPQIQHVESAKVTVTLSTTGQRETIDGTTVFMVRPTVESVVLSENDNVDGSTINNIYTPKTEWQLTAAKYFYGFGEPGADGYRFTMAELAEDPTEAEDLSKVGVKGDEYKWTAHVQKEDFNKETNKTDVAFDAIEYTVEGKAEDGKRDDRGVHWYLVTEDGGTDPTAFVVVVNVDLRDDGKTLAAEPTNVYYADDVNSALVVENGGLVDLKASQSEENPVTFYNTDTTGLFSAAGYKVYAASGAPVDQVCYVDPKIIKNLEGRAIKTGEFAFKLIQVKNYDDTEGELISATTNDEIGMVDFDKAADKTGDLENPSCLEYKNAGTYYYRVIEDKSNGGMSDESVLYSDQIITFTTVIEKDADGKLVCTDMYYGYWDANANKNVRFDEQYEDYDTNPANIGDFTKLNPKWHPTITNKVRPMDLQVRKTSTADPTEGLAGATYGLYMVSGSSTQGDILLDEATSEEGGWITFKNVSLATGNLYYFQETAAPAGHTVSQFRSDYFSLKEDAAAPNGYVLAYSSTKDEQPQTQVEVAPKAAGAGSETQPSYSEDGSILLTYNSNGGVSDEPTQVDVNKLDTRTREWVEGAELAIIEKDTGKEVISWTSGSAPQKLEKTLNVGTTYILRETQAPENYNKAKDVEFVIDSYGNVSVLSGTENGNAELSDNTITLYDTMLDTEVVDTEEREIPREERETGLIDRLLAQTGDTLSIVGLGLLALVSLVVVCVALRRRNSHRKSDN